PRGRKRLCPVGVLWAGVVGVAEFARIQRRPGLNSGEFSYEPKGPDGAIPLHCGRPKKVPFRRDRGVSFMVENRTARPGRAQMADTPLARAVRGLRYLVGGSAARGLSDGQLLTQFATRRDEDAFAELVRRHGPMVLGVCRRVLGNAHDAEDAFQAAFLILARKAAAAARYHTVGGWLHEVA